jgi:hypothetical protein
MWRHYKNSYGVYAEKMRGEGGGHDPRTSIILTALRRTTPPSDLYQPDGTEKHRFIDSAGLQSPEDVDAASSAFWIIEDSISVHLASRKKHLLSGIPKMVPK